MLIDIYCISVELKSANNGWCIGQTFSHNDGIFICTVLLSQTLISLSPPYPLLHTFHHDAIYMKQQRGCLQHRGTHTDFNVWMALYNNK